MSSERVNNSSNLIFKMFHSNTWENDNESHFFFFDILCFSIKEIIIFLDEILEMGPTISLWSSKDHSLESLSILGINWSNQIQKFGLSSFNIFDTFNIKISSSKILLSDLSFLCEKVKVHCFDGQFYNGFGLHLFIFLIHDLFISC